MGMFDSLWGVRANCPECGAPIAGNLQTKSHTCTMEDWTLPDYIDGVERVEVRVFHFSAVCERDHYTRGWRGYVRNQVLHRLEAPDGTPVFHTEPTDGLRDALKQIRQLEAELRAEHSKGLAVAVALALKRNHEPKVLAELYPDLEVAIRRCTGGPAQRLFGLFGGPQTVFWKLTGEDQAPSTEDCDAALPSNSP